MNLFYSESRKPFVSFILVAVQFTCIFFILFSERFYPTSWLLVFYIAGIFLGIWAIYVMKEAKINITPDVVPGTQLITNGPYKIIRHPMYSAIFLTLLPLVVEYFSIPRLMIYILLIFNQIVKMRYEEQKLTKAFGEYEAYKRASWRIIPFIY